MATYTINARLTADITVKDLSYSAYMELIAFLDSLDADKPVLTAPAVTTTEPEPETKDQFSGVKVFGDCYPVLDIFRDAIANPDKYRIVEMTTKDFQSIYPELKDLCTNNIGRTLGSISKIQNMTPAKFGVDGKYHYRVPVPVDCDYTEQPKRNRGRPKKEQTEETDEDEIVIDPAAYSMGKALRKAREERGMSVAELSRSIGYNPGIIINWELGVYTMSSGAIDSIKKLFGYDVFDTLKTA